MSNSLGNTIALSQTAQDLWAQGSSKDAELLVELNKPQRKKINYGTVSIAGIGEYLNEDIAALFTLVIDETISHLSQQADIELRAKGALVKAFSMRFNTFGLDLHNDKVRAQLSAILTESQKVPQEIIDATLALGYTLQSVAQEKLGRPATQADIDQYREWTAKEKVRNDYQNGFSPVKTAYGDGDRVALVTALRELADNLENG